MSIKRFFSISLILALGLPATRAFAQEPRVLSLQDAFDYAVKNNATAKNARLDVLIQEVQNAQTTAVALPKITGKGEFDDYVNPPVTFFPNDAINLINPAAGLPSGQFQQVSFTPRYGANGYLNGSQTLFDGSILVALQARKTVMELAKQNGKLTEEGIRYNVQRAYYSLVIAQRQFAIVGNSLQTAREIAHDIAVLRQNGLAEKIEEDRTTVQVNNLATDSLRISNILTVSEQMLKYQMGMDINQPIVLSDTALENNLSQAAALTAEDVSYEQRTEFQLLQTQQKLNFFNLKRYKLAALPVLSVFANTGYTYSSDNFSKLFYAHNYVFSFLGGVQLNVPIFNGLLRRNQVKEARLDIEKTQNTIDNTKLTIDFQAAQSKTTLKNALLQMESQQRNVQLANTVLDLSRKKYKAGVGSNIEVNQAQNDLLNAQNNYFNSLLDIVNAQADLQKALGDFK